MKLKINFCSKGVLGISHLVVILFCRCIYLFAISASYAIHDVGRGAHEVITDVNGSLGSQYLLGIVNERTSFASYASEFKNAGLVISLE